MSTAQHDGCAIDITTCRTCVWEHCRLLVCMCVLPVTALPVAAALAMCFLWLQDMITEFDHDHDSMISEAEFMAIMSASEDA